MALRIGHAGALMELPEGRRILAGDIGGTKCNLAIFEIAEGKFNITEEHSFQSAAFITFEELVETFYRQSGQHVDVVSLGIAGPVLKGKVKATNLPWEIDADSISRRLDVANVFLLNDLEVNAYGLAVLEENDLRTIATGDHRPEGNAAVIAPGTGLGEAGMFWDGDQWHPFATEGGHGSFSPRDTLDVALFEYLRKKFGHVSWERVLSGPGIYNIFCFLKEELNRPVADMLSDEIKNAKQPSPIITKAAIDGKCDTCLEVLRLFVKYLGEESAHLSLKMKATGGLFIGGGIVPDILYPEFNDIFTKAFLDIGRMKPLLETVPVKIIMNEKTSLLGAGYYGAFHVAKL